MKRIHMIPNIITTFGLACGLFVIFKANLKVAGTYELLHASTLLLVVAALADVLDGAVARLMKAQSDFGIMFDSLADAISFGVAPSVLFLRVIHLEELKPLAFFAVLSAMVYTIGGVLRLVRFSTTTEESIQKNFRGLPIPAAAAVAVSLNLFLHSPLLESYIHVKSTIATLIIIAFNFLLSYLMISNFRFPSLKALHIRVPSFQLIMGTMIIAIIILYGILYFFPLILVVVSLGYLFLGVGLSLVRRILGKRSRSLTDFDPHDE